MVRLYVLGELRLEVDGEPVELPVSRKARLLLAMLALERRAHGRGELAGRLWPDVREDSARASLRNALAQLRGAFGVHAASVVTTAGGETITLAPNVVTDLGELDGLFRAGRAEEAADACVAQLLSGFDDDWSWQRTGDRTVASDACTRANIRTEGGSTAAVPPPVGPSAVRYARTGGRSIAYQRFGAGASELLIVPGCESRRGLGFPAPGAHVRPAW